MSFNIVTVPTSAIPQSASNFKRRTSSYHPTIWGETFLSNLQQAKTVDDSIEQEYENLKGEVRGMLNDSTWKPSQKLRLVDAVQRLGVGYHFESEIEEILSNRISHDTTNNEEDLYTASLRFRLLRQQGIKISSDMFKKFKDENGEFRESLRDDVQGMLSLYEATFLGIRGEAILDEALSFTTKHLQEGLDHLTPFSKEQVKRALKRPIRKWLTRLEARHYLTFYDKEESHNQTLLKFAKLDFNILQGLHQKELFGITEWWRSLNVPMNFPYARDRIVECFFWISGVYFEPKYSFGRKTLTKIIAMTSIIDDTYDNFATLDELEIFTEAFRRLDIKEIDRLPDYMKKIYRIPIDIYAEIEDVTAHDGRSFCAYYAKEAIKQLLEAFLVEAKWREEGYVPTMDEYLQISITSTGYPMLSTSSFVGMGKFATKEAFEWVSHQPKIVKAATVICRLMDDILAPKYEKNRDHVATGIECYMKQHNISEEEVIKFFKKEVDLAWKDINEEFLRPTPVPMPLLDRVLNLARVMELIYKDDDGYINSYVIKGHVSLLFKDPVY